MLGSFKIKLVGTFLALSVVPLAAAFWGFSAVAERSVTSGVDDRLEAGLNAALAAFEDERRNAETRCAAPRGGPAVPDRARATAIERASRSCCPARRRCASRHRTASRVGKVPSSLPPRRRSPSSARATVPSLIIASVPLTRQLAQRLHARSGLSSPDELVFVDKKRQVGAASKAGVQRHDRARAGAGGDLDDRRSRVPRDRRAPRAGEHDDARRGDAELGDRVREAERARPSAGRTDRLAAPDRLSSPYLAGRSIVGALGRLADAAHSIAAGRLEERVEVRGRDEFAQLGRAFNQMASQLEGRLEDLEDERRRLRDANARFGDALASSLDPEQLRRVIVESAVEATQADGGVVIAEDGSYVETGDVGGGGERLDFELTSGRRSFGRLLLVGDDFDAEERMTAASLAGQAVVALENARLHRMVERQALVDGLTGLANRRQADEALAQRDRPDRAARRPGRPDPRRRRRLQGRERPVRPPDRRRRPARPRGDPARERA